MRATSWYRLDTKLLQHAGRPATCGKHTSTVVLLQRPDQAEWKSLLDACRMVVKVSNTLLCSTLSIMHHENPHCALSYSEVIGSTVTGASSTLPRGNPLGSLGSLLGGKRFAEVRHEGRSKRSSAGHEVVVH